MRFNGNQPRVMQFGRVKIGDHYSVSPEATLGLTQGRTRERNESRVREITREERLASDKLESKRIASQRIQEFESRRFESSSSTVV
jgi:hypothetical protein